MKWITREKPKIDRVACPWLIKRFIERDAEIIYVPEQQVLKMAKKLNAIPFDVPDVEFTHYKDECTFDYFIKKYKLNDAALLKIATIVRGADTDRHDLAPESSGLWAISAGLAHASKDDHDMLEKGMVVYDALYDWAKYHQHEKHVQNAGEHELYMVLKKFLRAKTGKKVPSWVEELRNIIQDHVDANFTLKQVSENLNVNPSYLSREFSKYFTNLSFGEYTRKLRIERAMELISHDGYSLTEIAYLTGFSDQSHFTRVFKSICGKSPSAYKKELQKSKKDTRG
jgi:AraC-like DNA-binding protein